MTHNSDQLQSSIKTFNVSPRTVFMTVGPSACGKTTFCTQVLKAQLPGIVKYLSSDDIRLELLNQSNVDKYAPEMLTMSHLAFEQLFSRAKAYMTWPCSADFIIIDTTGLNEGFRKRVVELCNENNYSLSPVIFDYKTYGEYYTYAIDKTITTKHVEELRLRTIPGLNREFRDKIKDVCPITIRSRDFTQVNIEVKEWNKYQACFLPNNSKCVIVGNVGGCYQELILLLKQFRIELDDGMLKSNEQIILLGNPYRDDSSDQIRSFIEKNNIICVYENGLPFVSIRNRWIVTGAYQEKKYLGSTKHSREGVTIVDDSVFNEPYRIFGSYPSLKFERKDNLYLIDGGCVHGGELIGLRFGRDGKPFTKKQRALATYVVRERKLLFPRELEVINVDSLAPIVKSRHNKIVNSAAPFLSGTMSPAPADIKSGNITLSAFESLSQALLYYKWRGISHVCLQPKYMGSRCTIVLSLNGSSYAISRGGFTIRIPGMSDLLDQLKIKFLKDNIVCAIIDGELLPWSAMGRSLIDNTFRSVEVGLSKDVELLKKFGFDKQLDKLAQARSTINLPLQKNNANKIGHGLYHTMVSYDAFSSDWMGVDALERGLHTYSEQLALFAVETALEFKPFALLKTIDKSGKETIYDEPAGVNFERVSSDAHVVVSTDDLSEAEAFYRSITEDQRMEGIVIKPETRSNYLDNCLVPYMKVRNQNYLTLIYGPTYQEPRRLAALIKRKKVTNKQRLSRLQYDISQEILRIPTGSLGSSNSYYCDLVATFLQTNQEESKVDPRL